MENSKKFYSANMFRVCIDAYKEDISGRLYSPLSTEEITFGGVGELLLKMDKLFDKVGYPQAFQNKRSFDGAQDIGNAYRGIPKVLRTGEDIMAQVGEYSTYDVEVTSRRNTSWQGVIYTAEGVRKGEFNGEVELLALFGQLNQQ